MILYSANTGEKDVMTQPDKKHDGVEYVYFVDDKTKYSSTIWDIRNIENRFDTPNMNSKWYKLHPHLLFPGENTIWIDANYKPGDDPSSLFLDDIMLYEHTSRHCLYAEADFCLKKDIGNADLLRKQVAYYKEKGMPKDFGLFMGGLLVRTPAVASFNEEWWEQILRFSSRDQLGLAYTLWRGNVSFSTFPNGYKNKYYSKARSHLRHNYE